MHNPKKNYLDLFPGGTSLTGGHGEDEISSKLICYYDNIARQASVASAKALGTIDSHSMLFAGVLLALWILMFPDHISKLPPTPTSSLRNK